MSTVSQYKEVLRAMLKGDTETAKRLSDQIVDAPWKESGALVTAVCAILAEDHFDNDDSPAAIKRFVTDMMNNYADADPPLKPLVGEAVVRVALGESELMKGIDINDFTIHQMAFVNKIVEDDELSDRQVDELLDEAEALLAQM